MDDALVEVGSVVFTNTSSEPMTIYSFNFSVFGTGVDAITDAQGYINHSTATAVLTPQGIIGAWAIKVNAGGMTLPPGGNVQVSFEVRPTLDPNAANHSLVGGADAAFVGGSTASGAPVADLPQPLTLTLQEPPSKNPNFGAFNDYTAVPDYSPQPTNDLVDGTPVPIIRTTFRNTSLTETVTVTDTVFVLESSPPGMTPVTVVATVNGMPITPRLDAQGEWHVTTQGDQVSPGGEHVVELIVTYTGVVAGDRAWAVFKGVVGVGERGEAIAPQQLLTGPVYTTP